MDVFFASSAYAVYGLKGIASDGIVERARAFIMKCLGPELEDAPFRYPEVALALPHFCSSIEQHKSEIEQEFASGAYQRGALLLFIISEHQEEEENRSCSDWAHGMLGEFENRTNSQIADVNRPGLSLIGLTLLNLGLDIGYLLNARDYSAVQSFFESNTVDCTDKD